MSTADNPDRSAGSRWRRAHQGKPIAQTPPDTAGNWYECRWTDRPEQGQAGDLHWHRGAPPRDGGATQ